MALPPTPPAPAPGSGAPLPPRNPAVPAPGTPLPPGSPVPVRPSPTGAPAASAPRKPMGQNIAQKPRPKIQTIMQKDVAIVTILESRILDESNINELGQQLMDLVKKQYMIKMIIDLGEVKYLSSAVLRQLIALYKAIKEEKGDLKICRCTPDIRELFKMTQLDKMIEIKDDLESAVNAFKKQGGFGFLKR